MKVQVLNMGFSFRLGTPYFAMQVSRGGTDAAELALQRSGDEVARRLRGASPRSRRLVAPEAANAPIFAGFCFLIRIVGPAAILPNGALLSVARRSIAVGSGLARRLASLFREWLGLRWSRPRTVLRIRLSATEKSQ